MPLSARYELSRAFAGSSQPRWASPEPFRPRGCPSPPPRRAGSGSAPSADPGRLRAPTRPAAPPPHAVTWVTWATPLPRPAGLSRSAPDPGGRAARLLGPSGVPDPPLREARVGGGGPSGEIGTGAPNEGEQMSLCCWEARVACCSDGGRRGADLPGPPSVSVQMARPPPCPLLRAGTAAAGGSAARGSRLRRGGGAGGGAGREGRAGPAHKGAPAAAPRRTMQPRGAGGCAALQLPLHSEACKRAHLILNPLRRLPCEPGRGWPSEPLQPQAWSPGALRAVCSAHANRAGVLETRAESAG